MLLMVVLWFRVLKMNFDPHVTANETISGFKRIFTLIKKRTLIKSERNEME